MTDPPNWYDNNLQEAAARFESVGAEDVHQYLINFLPAAPGALVMDVGSGTGRDAAWLAQRGIEVVAVEPSKALLDFARQHHPSPAIRWISDSMPDLGKVMRLGLSFDLILVSAVWMFVPPPDRPRAFRKMITLLRPGGRLAITLRRGPPAVERGMHPVSVEEIESLARLHGASLERIETAGDLEGREGISWTNLLIRLPDDGTGALPLLRQIILNDDKSSTYKLALLRVICRIADGAAGYGRHTADGFVAIPLGLVALFWVRLFKPLLKADLPQSPVNRGPSGLGFAGEGFRALDSLSPLDLRIGSLFLGETATALHRALREACDTITKMPATYMTYADGAPILPFNRPRRGVRTPASIEVDAEYLGGFGELQVPLHIWRAMQRFDVWIEPAITTEWSRLMETYASRQSRVLRPETITAAMAWSDPKRDVGVARRQALRLLESESLFCVWSGRRLTPQTLDIDHCFPWAAWPCDDLWNLMPAHRAVNQNLKRSKLPGAALLKASQDRIEGWWDRGYLKSVDGGLPKRFGTEANASLPMLAGDRTQLEDVFAAVGLQQMQLRANQGIPVWENLR
jgi:SAM-dependent methyltransferase